MWKRLQPIVITIDDLIYLRIHNSLGLSMLIWGIRICFTQCLLYIVVMDTIMFFSDELYFITCAEVILRYLTSELCHVRHINGVPNFNIIMDGNMLELNISVALGITLNDALITVVKNPASCYSKAGWLTGPFQLSKFSTTLAQDNSVAIFITIPLNLVLRKYTKHQKTSKQHFSQWS